MSAGEALKVARAAGIRIAVDGRDLLLLSPSPAAAGRARTAVAAQGRHRGVSALTCVNRLAPFASHNSEEYPSVPTDGRSLANWRRLRGGS